MTQIQIFVILSGIVLTVLIAWYFWFAPKAQTRAVDLHAPGEFGVFGKSIVSRFQSKRTITRGRASDIGIHPSQRR